MEPWAVFLAMLDASVVGLERIVDAGPRRAAPHAALGFRDEVVIAAGLEHRKARPGLVSVAVHRSASGRRELQRAEGVVVALLDQGVEMYAAPFPAWRWKP